MTPLRALRQETAAPAVRIPAGVPEPWLPRVAGQWPHRDGKLLWHGRRGRLHDGLNTRPAGRAEFAVVPAGPGGYGWPHEALGQEGFGGKNLLWGETTMTRLPVRILFASLVLLAASPAWAVGDPNDPNWPCVQRKVPEITLGAVWTGPAFDPKTVKWADDPEVAALVPLISQRRTPIADVEKAVTDFAATAGDRKAERLTLVFAGAFEALNGERRDVINGISRFATKQRAFADQVRATTADLDKFRSDPSADPMEVQARTDEMLTKTRVFEERQKALTFVCEVPVNIEQRLFAIGKAIVGAMK